MKIDIHTHILPAIDDGAKNEKESIVMLEMLKKQGITEVCFTPHFDPRTRSKEAFAAKRREAYNRIKDAVLQSGITPHFGAEVKLYPNLFNNESLELLCIDGKKHILIEMPFEPISENAVIDRLYKLCADYSVIPILVHPERYKKFFNENFLCEACNAGCLVQVDNDVFGNIFLRGKAKRFVEDGLVHLIASDCHNTSDRRPNFDVAKKFLGEELFEEITQNSMIINEAP